MNQTTEIAKVGNRGIEINSINELKQRVKDIVEGGLAPRGMDTPQKVMLSIQHGMELGMTMMQALQSCMVVNGKVSVYGDGLAAVAQASGKLKSRSEGYEGEGDNLTAWVKLERNDIEGVIEARFSVADAKQAGVWGKAGPWKDYPRRMLMMRARAWAYRDCFSDALKGMGIVEEERDFAEGPVVVQSESRISFGVEEPEQPEQPPVEEIIDAESTPVELSEGERKKMRAEAIANFQGAIDECKTTAEVDEVLGNVPPALRDEIRQYAATVETEPPDADPTWVAYIQACNTVDELDQLWGAEVKQAQLPDSEISELEGVMESRRKELLKDSGEMF